MLIHPVTSGCGSCVIPSRCLFVCGRNNHCDRWRLWHGGPILSHGFIAPGILLPDFLVVEHLEEYTTNDWPRGKTDFSRSFSLIPVGHRRTIRCRIQESNDRSNQGFKVRAVLRERRRPRNPVEFGVSFTVVERQSVLVVLHLLVIIHFFLLHFCGK